MRKLDTKLNRISSFLRVKIIIHILSYDFRKHKNATLRWRFYCLVELAGIGNPCQPVRLHAHSRSQARRVRLETAAHPESRGFDTSTAQIKKHPIGCFLIWWSWRESNPRPQILHRQFYILSLVV